MQSRNKFLDDLAQLATNAMGVAQGAREEAAGSPTAISSRARNSTRSAPWPRRHARRTRR
jgi:hypothetical protein